MVRVGGGFSRVPKIHGLPGASGENELGARDCDDTRTCSQVTLVRLTHPTELRTNFAGGLAPKPSLI